MLVLLLWSCQDNNLELDDQEQQVVIEGWLSDLDTIQFIKISLSQNFLDNSGKSYIEDAGVKIRSSNGVTIDLIHSSNGLYSTQSTYSGQEGINYFLEVRLSDGRIIQSSTQKMASAPSLDTINFEYYERESATNENIIEQVFYPITQINDNGEEENYYRFKVYKNDTLFKESENILLINDKFFNGNSPFIENEFTSFEFFESDSIGLELQEITSTGYNYLRNLKNQTTSLGSTSFITPGPINGNMFYLNSDEKVLGYWGTCSIQTNGIKIIQ
ncbi:DUF4249 domain-containing protein [Marinoscillum pacificum]|uniref:DUF4249 domain-containing protein n=1 Tax=Marinoscillum pacificum TaxID=392723 RepID=UPI0021573E0E|nr:DUF4249 domain-containing protein [Marinoscillum pacificum]